jgi:large subunit ribosomal protein L30
VKALRITLRKSAIGSIPLHRKVLRGLGLGKIDSSVVRPDDPSIRGMIQKVIHLVEVEPVPDSGAAGGERP